MEISWSIDPSRGLVHLVYRGEPDFPTWASAMERILEHPDHRQGMGFVADLTGSGFPDNAHLRRVTDWVRENADRLGPYRWANVTGHPVHYGMSRMAQVFLEGMEAELAIFETMDEAEAWAARRPGAPGG